MILGIVSSLVNPYWILWWVTIGFGYMATARRFGIPGLVASFLGHIAADYGWYILIALGISRGKTIIPDKGYRIMIRCCGIFLVGFGRYSNYNDQEGEGLAIIDMHRDNLLQFLEQVAAAQLSTILYVSHRQDEYRDFFKQHLQIGHYT